MVVNDHLRLGPRPFVRAQMQYNPMRHAGNGRPGPGDSDSNFISSAAVPPNDVPASDFYNGVYLKWRLPRAFTHGRQDAVSGRTEFPLVPNRWLVVRYGGDLTARTATAWIVESDHEAASASPSTVAERGSIYLGSGPGKPPPAIYLGRNVPLGSWTEPGTPPTLTAVGPGNPAFAFYQPQCNNIFSFVDVLGDAPAATLSYRVF